MLFQTYPYHNNYAMFLSYVLIQLYQFLLLMLLLMHWTYYTYIYIVDNILNEEYKELILSSKLILVDTFHDGTFEQQFHDYLNEINWKGVLLLDDIKLNQEMINYWNNIKENKTDITQYGHDTGTGIVYFE